MTQTPAAAPFTLYNPEGLYDPAPNAYSHLAAVAPGAEWLFVAASPSRSSRRILLVLEHGYWYILCRYGAGSLRTSKDPQGDGVRRSLR